MGLSRFFGGKKTAIFQCVYKECESLCCKKNLVVLNEDDVSMLMSSGFELNEITNPLSLKSFLQTLGAPSFQQLDGLNVLRLKHDEDERCVFLEKDGRCRIYKHRPYYCREFPFKFSGEKIKSSNPLCPGVGKGGERSVSEIKLLLGLDTSGLKPPHLEGDPEKIRLARGLMSSVFRFLK